MVCKPNLNVVKQGVPDRGDANIPLASLLGLLIMKILKA